MPHRLFPIQTTFPREFFLIGKILLQYGELELALMNCVHMGRGGDLDTVFKSMFRIRGEKQRIEKAQELGQTSYAALDLLARFEKAIGWMHYCRRIRNQYAHAYWHDDNTGRLCFVGMEDLAKEDIEVNDLLGLRFYYLDVPLLEEQELFFRYTEGAFTYLNYQGRLLRNQVGVNPMPEINDLNIPPLHYPH